MTTNEGFMHLIDADDGTEHFAFMPQELLPLIRQVNKDDSASSGKFRYDIYGLDGSPVVLRKDLNGNEIIDEAEGDKVIVYLTQRRGGRNIYAVDITDRDNPELLWTILGGAMNSFADLAETWSEPVLSKILVNKVKTDVLVFGGGYDSDRYDNDPGDPDDNVDIGRNVYIVNAHTGDLIWRIGPDIDADLKITTMADSIPSPIEILDFKDDQVMDRIYFIDVIGRIHKVDFDNSSGENTAIYGGGLVMDLSNNDPSNNVDQDSCDMSVAGNICRRFYNALDVAVMTKYPVANYIQLAVGSGFRAHPKMINTQDRFYVVYDNQLLYKVKTKDYAATYGWKEADNLVDVTDIGNGSKELQEQTKTLYESLTAADKHGWYLDMDKDLGEKVISESITINGIVMFSTYLPRTSSAGPDACSADLGGGRLYLTNAFDGMPVASLDQDSDAELLQVTDTVKKSQRFTLLPRAGMPTSPSIVFKKMASGEVTPTVVVGTQLPLNQDLLDITLETGTWWFEK
jgi:type IV pilus assembly protein PilY1